MATTKMWPIRTRLDHLCEYVANADKTANPAFGDPRRAGDLDKVIGYAADGNKTEQKFYVTGLNCQPETAYLAMRASLALNDKALKVLGYHAYQSFAQGEVDAKTAHEIGVKLAAELWSDRFQVIVATHLNTEHYHNHFVLCSTSFLDGKRFHACAAAYHTLRNASDRLCREYSLSVIENPQRGRTKHYAEWKAEQESKPTWRGIIKADIDSAVAASMTDRQFFYHLAQMGYEYRTDRKYFGVRPPGKERFFRLEKNLGEEYSLAGICKRILAQSYPKRPAPEPPRHTRSYRLRGSVKQVKGIGGLRGLYLHYCYKLGVLPKNRPSPARLHFLLREDLLKMHAISKEARLLGEQKIDTRDQLAAYKDSMLAQMQTLTARRKRLRSRARGNLGPDELAAVKTDIAECSEQLSKLRANVKLCEGIEARSPVMEAKLKQVRQEESTNRKEKMKHEPLR